MQNKITKEKIKKYKETTKRALKMAKESVLMGKEKEADEIITMVENYLADSVYFEKKGNFVDCFAAINYAHGWLDAGVRLDIFDVEDSKLFTIK